MVRLVLRSLGEGGCAVHRSAAVSPVAGPAAALFNLLKPSIPRTTYALPECARPRALQRGGINDLQIDRALILDPNPNVNGKSVLYLSENGIEVTMFFALLRVLCTSAFKVCPLARLARTPRLLRTMFRWTSLPANVSRRQRRLSFPPADTASAAPSTSTAWPIRVRR